MKYKTINSLLGKHKTRNSWLMLLLFQKVTQEKKQYSNIKDNYQPNIKKVYFKITNNITSYDNKIAKN